MEDVTLTSVLRDIVIVAAGVAAYHQAMKWIAPKQLPRPAAPKSGKRVKVLVPKYRA